MSDAGNLPIMELQTKAKPAQFEEVLSNTNNSSFSVCLSCISPLNQSMYSNILEQNFLSAAFHHKVSKHKVLPGRYKRQILSSERTWPWQA